MENATEDPVPDAATRGSSATGAVRAAIPSTDGADTGQVERLPSIVPGTVQDERWLAAAVRGARVYDGTGAGNEERTALRYFLLRRVEWNRELHAAAARRDAMDSIVRPDLLEEDFVVVAPGQGRGSGLTVHDRRDGPSGHPDLLHVDVFGYEGDPLAVGRKGRIHSVLGALDWTRGRISERADPESRPDAVAAGAEDDALAVGRDREGARTAGFHPQ
jgi:hypothetical protein